MSNEARGHAIKRRRTALGITSYDEFAKATGVSRGAITRAEKGDPAATEATYLRLETWLDRFEHETGSDAEDAAAVAQAALTPPTPAGNITIELSEGGSVTVQGPVGDAAEIEGIASRLLRIQIEARKRSGGNS